MSRGKKLLILALVLALLGAAAWMLTSSQQKKEEAKAAEEAAAQSEKIYVSDLVPADVKAVKWQCLSRSGETSRDGASWKVTTEDGSVKEADASVIDSLLAAVCNLEADKVIDDYGDPAQFGFDDPNCRIELTTDQGTVEIVIGDTTVGNADNYYCLNGDSHLYIVKGSFTEKFYLRNEDLLPASGN